MRSAAIFHPLACFPATIGGYNAAMNSSPEAMAANSFQQWLAQGEQLYSALARQYQAMEAQLIELESRLADKQAEIEQVARLLGKPVPQLNRRLSAQLVTHYPPSDVPSPRLPAAAQVPAPKPAPARAPIPPRTPPPIRVPG